MRLKYLRKQKGISQLKLAMDLSLNQNSISRYETGEREADYALLIKFADYFDVSVDYLLERTDNPEMKTCRHRICRLFLFNREFHLRDGRLRRRCSVHPHPRRYQ